MIKTSLLDQTYRDGFASGRKAGEEWGRQLAQSSYDQGFADSEKAIAATQPNPWWRFSICLLWAVAAFIVGYFA